MMATEAGEGGGVLERCLRRAGNRPRCHRRQLAPAARRPRRPPTAAVVKADAYGLGARRVAPRLYAAGCRHFFVAHLAEALAIRAAGARCVARRAERAAARHRAGVSRPRDRARARFARRDRALGRLCPPERARRCRRCMHVDTGMNRLGLEPDELRVLAAEPERLEGILLRYVLTHLASADVPGDTAERGRSCASSPRPAAGLPPAPRSIANSSGLFLGRCVPLRPGASRRGALRHQPRHRRRIRCSPAVRAARAGAAGADIGGRGRRRLQCNLARRPAEPHRHRGHRLRRRLAARALQPRGRATLTARPVPLVGRVSMDLTHLRRDRSAGIGPGDWLELIGPRLPAGCGRGRGRHQWLRDR